jgi:hypothetical protein
MLDQIPYRKVKLDLPKIPKSQPQPKGVDGSFGAGQEVDSKY